MRCKLPEINNQDGSLMVVALLIMATLAIAGLMVTNDAVMESRVTRNYVIHKQCVMAAEASGKEIMQGIDSIFETSVSSLVALETLDNLFWKPYDNYNTTFEFDPDQWDTSYSARIKPSIFKDGNSGSPDLDYFTSIGAIVVLEDQTTSALSPGLSSTKMRQLFEYNVF